MNFNDKNEEKNEINNKDNALKLEIFNALQTEKEQLLMKKNIIQFLSY